MAWRGRRLGEAGDSGLELSLGLPAYFSKTPAPGSGDAGEGPSEASALARQAGNGSNAPKARARPAAAPVVGWPPVRSFRRNLASARPPPAHHQDGGGKEDGGGAKAGAERGHRPGGLFVKINMDGVPIGRKVDLKAYGGYAELSAAVGKLFRGLLAAQRDPAASQRRGADEGAAAAEEEEELVIGAGGSGEYTLVYEDEEGDRVLVGDVPWEMFVATARRLRVLKSSDLPVLRGGRKRAASGF
ncbi:hypothetical protein ACP4OV_031475 [Aristida adscensionis]